MLKGKLREMKCIVSGKMIPEQHDHLLGRGQRLLQYHTLRKQTKPNKNRPRQHKSHPSHESFFEFNSFWLWDMHLGGKLRYCLLLNGDEYLPFRGSSKPLKEAIKDYYSILPHWCIQGSSQPQIFIFVSSQLKALWKFIRRLFTP